MKKLRKYVPLPVQIIFPATAMCTVIYVLFRASPAFAEFFNSNISPVFRWIYTNISNLLPFSSVEFLLLFSPVIIVYIFIYAARHVKLGDGGSIRAVTSVIAAAAFVFISFTLVYSPAYFGKSLEEKAGLDASGVTADELSEVFSRLTDEINLLCEKNEFPTKKSGATEMPGGFFETVDKIEDAYVKINAEYPFIQKLRTVAKPVILSPLMTYTHISGIYSFYTGEVNINTNYPDYIVTSTIAHEMAHQRGIAKEDEANFTAFLVLVNSEDDYLKYSGYLDVYTTVGNALLESSEEDYKSIRRRLCNKAQAELNAYSDFFDKYRDNAVNKISESFNDAYLKSQGTAGSVSYDLVTELVVAYYRQ